MTLNSMLITERNDELVEFWICVDKIYEPTVYAFYDKGIINGFEKNYLGSEYSIRPNVRPFHYSWRVLDESTIRVFSPPAGLMDTWSEINFLLKPEENGLFTNAVSKAKGQLYCTLEGRRP